MFTQEANLNALFRASDLLFGDDASRILAKTADVIYRAMRDSYDLGRMAAEEDVEERIDNAFDEGFEQGSAFQSLEDAEQIIAAREDEYLKGVYDARYNKQLADDETQRIAARRAAEYYDERVQDEA